MKRLTYAFKAGWYATAVFWNGALGRGTTFTGVGRCVAVIMTLLIPVPGIVAAMHAFFTASREDIEA